MSRLMSVAMTTDAVIERRKTVSRRANWWEDKNGRRLLKVGDALTLCRKVQGRKPGEPIERLAEVETVTVWREPLNTLTDYEAFCADYNGAGLLDMTRERWEEWRAGEMTREGFPGMDPAEFVDQFFVSAQGMAPDAEVTRIEWRYLDVCQPCADNARCETCDERMCAEYGPEPRACGTTCAACRCDCTPCRDARDDLRAELLSQFEREAS